MKMLKAGSRTYMQHLRTFAACCATETNLPSSAAFSFSSSPIAPTVPPQPGTVKRYDHHILVKLARPDDAPSGCAWWPSLVESHPAIMGVFKGLAMRSTDRIGTVKVTAYNDLQPGNSADATICDFMIFPAGKRYKNFPVALIDGVVGSWVGSTKAGPQSLPVAAAACQEDINPRKLFIFVCCHGSRDARCGVKGLSLATELSHLISARGLHQNIEVYATSHIGGHKYAANVIVYGAFHPGDGDWFGGLSVDSASAFLDALLGVDLGSNGGAEDNVLRQWWRGRIGLTRQEQLELWEAGGVVEEAMGEESGEEEEEEEEDRSRLQ